MAVFEHDINGVLDPVWAKAYRAGTANEFFQAAKGLINPRSHFFTAGTSHWTEHQGTTFSDPILRRCFAAELSMGRRCMTNNL